MLTALFVASAISVVTGGIAYARSLRLRRQGCPTCHGPVEGGGSWLRCRPRARYWNLDGTPVGELPPAEARLLSPS